MIIRQLHSLQKFTKALQIKKHVVKHKKQHFRICISLLIAAYLLILHKIQQKMQKIQLFSCKYLEISEKSCIFAANFINQ